MDPLSITTACVSLLSGITNLSKHISVFISEVRDARKDMDAVSRELTSLALCLELLRDDSTTINYSEGFRKDLIGVLQSCDFITHQMKAILRKLSSGNVGRRIQWSLSSREEMNNLRSSLEAHKSAIEIALTLGSITVMNTVKKNTTTTRHVVAAIKQDTTAILQSTLHVESQMHILSDVKHEFSTSPLRPLRPKAALL